MARRWLNNGVTRLVDDNGRPLRSSTDVSGSDPFAGITRDATSNIYIPATAGEFTSLRNAGSVGWANPNSLYNCNEPSGDLGDAIGTLTLTAANTPSYQTAATGWSKKGVSAAAGSTSRFAAASGTGPSPGATSVLWMFIIDLTAVPGAARGIISGGGAVAATGLAIGITTGSKTEAWCVNVATDGTSDVVAGNARPFALQYDRTSSAIRAISNAEIVTGTYSALVTDGLKGLFASANYNSAACTALWGCMWSGANAEVSTATIKSLWQTQGWSVAW